MPASTRIEDYALIGDLQTAALVSREGSIDWCCFSRFDSGACFAAILGRPDHGRWLLAPATRIEHASRRYRRDTLILESIFTTATGRVRTIDFMPPRRDGPGIVRIVEGLEGRVPIRSQLVVRFDFGRVLPWVRRLDDALVAIAGPDGLCLRTPVEAHGEQMTTVSDFVVEAGERIPFVLTWFPSHEDLPEPIDPEQALDESESYWLEWANSCEHTGEYHEEIHRSLRVLKALTYAPTGGIVAAPTTSLPELIGGVRNWDYRFCWLRDATLTLLTMLNAGYRHEAEAWRQWLLRAVAGAPGDLQIMYGIAGERRLEERELDWLPGYLDSRPVRVGNAASQQLQLDVYGEVLDALYQALVHGAAPDDNAWSILTQLLRWLEEGWRQKDCGIWEVRGSPRHFTHSKVMAWVAFDRAVRLHGEFGRQGAAARWRALREEIRTEILARAWSPKKRVFVQAYDSDRLDASVLQMPLVGFLPARDPRIVSTVERIQRELTIDGLVLRYRPREGGCRRPSRWRSCVPALFVLARPGAGAAGEAAGGPGAVRAAPRPAERRGPTLRGVRPSFRPPARKLPAGVLAPRPRRRCDHTWRRSSDRCGPRGRLPGRRGGSAHATPGRITECRNGFSLDRRSVARLSGMMRTLLLILGITSLLGSLPLAADRRPRSVSLRPPCSCSC
jgi:GH15 family glucan-1,4-alpha-glucosidase